ncbi:vanadium-dependent haloperoxidase [Kitasatospora sp. NPDC006697]|uniref:vanadium-dependent haloperoxidase n=1 Tax=Kitasatospora sp. NPDC006697 TaxID=3364020 RepID=UPI00367D6569
MHRRDVLRTAVIGTGLLAAGGLAPAAASADGSADGQQAAPAQGQAETQSGVVGRGRSDTGRDIRDRAARTAYPDRMPDHPVNDDQRDFPYLAVYGKGLPHNAAGEVDPAGYRTMIRAFESGRGADFDKIPMGLASGGRKQLGPQGGLAFDLLGPDSHALVVPPAPRVGSAEGASEMAELYWMALLRDVPFAALADSPLAAQAADDLSRYAGFRGPRQNGRVTPGTLFRSDLPGALAGPFVSQFLVRDHHYGTQPIRQLRDTVQPGLDFATGFDEWLAVQNGANRLTSRDFTNLRYIQTGRDMAHHTHFDVLYQCYLTAAVILLTDPAYPAQLQDQGNPYLKSANQMGFPTFGTPHLVTLLAEVANRAIKHTEYQQFFVHRRLRPEEYAGRIEVHLNRDRGRYTGFLPEEILDSEVGDRIQAKYGTRLLPQSFPEASPMSPSYQSGHSTVAGACVTVLKAWFNESFVLANPVQPSADGTTLVPYTGADKDQLTVGGELNKLAANVAAGRAMAGVHYRSDNTEAFVLGEEIALDMMREQKRTYIENGTFTVTRFDGTTVTI